MKRFNNDEEIVVFHNCLLRKSLLEKPFNILLDEGPILAIEIILKAQKINPKIKFSETKNMRTQLDGLKKTVWVIRITF